MQLVLSNAQSELSPLEIGVHALEAVTLGIGGREKGGLSEYARQIGKGRTYVTQVRNAAEVLKAVKPFSQLNGLLDKAQHLNAVHLAPSDTWPFLVDALLTNDWTVDDTEKAVKRVKDLLAAIPGWWTVDRQSILEWDEPDTATCVPLSR